MTAGRWGAEGPAHPGGGAGSVMGVPWIGNESEKGGEVPASRGGFLPWLCEQGGASPRGRHQMAAKYSGHGTSFSSKCRRPEMRLQLRMWREELGELAG